MTFASKITIARIGLVPVFACLAVAYSHTTAAGAPDEALRWWALGVFILAASTDGVDGWVARRFNQCSSFGAFIDPIADKALLLTGVITLSMIDWGSPGWKLPTWFAGIVILRDCIILGGIRILWSRRRSVTFKPHWTGKICTVAQMVALGWVMLRVTIYPPELFCVVAAVFTVWSCLAYLKKGWTILHGRNRLDREKT